MNVCRSSVDVPTSLSTYIDPLVSGEGVGGIQGDSTQVWQCDRANICSWSTWVQPLCCCRCGPKDRDVIQGTKCSTGIALVAARSNDSVSGFQVEFQVPSESHGLSVDTTSLDHLDSQGGADEATLLAMYRAYNLKRI